MRCSQSVPVIVVPFDETEFLHQRSLVRAFSLVPKLNQVLIARLFCRDVIEMLGQECYFDSGWNEFRGSPARSFDVDDNAMTARGNKCAKPLGGIGAHAID